MQTMKCKCQRDARLQQVKKDGPNNGKFFWSCGTCNFFAWHHGKVPTEGSLPPIPSPTLTTPKSSPNCLVLQVKCEMNMAVLPPDGADAVCVCFPTACSMSPPVVAILQNPTLNALYVSPGKYYVPIPSYPSMCQMIEAIPRTPSARVDVMHLPQHIWQVLKRQEFFTHKPVENGRIPESITTKLLPFQKDGVQFAIDRSGKVFIGDEMGLGKTIQAIAIASYYSQEWPLLVLCPCSLKYTWRNEIIKWMPSINKDRIGVMGTGRNSMSMASDCLVNIVPYSLASPRLSTLTRTQFKVVIIDESHYLKEGKTKRSQAVQTLVRGANRVILLSGTALLAKPMELHSQLQLVWPDFINMRAFGDRYCGPRPATFASYAGAMDYTGNSHLLELAWMLRRTVMVRRKKCDVLKDLPAKTRQEICVEITDSERAAMKSQLAQLAKSRDGEVTGGGVPGGAPSPSALELFYTSSKAKQAGVCEYVTTLMEGEEKFLVFAHFKEMLNAVENAVKKCCEASKGQGWDYIRIDGSTPVNNRQGLVDKFRSEDNCKVAVLSMTAAGTGYTFTPCSTVVFAELYWTPSVLNQCEDRVHRMGQHNCCTAQYLIAPGTIDEVLWPSLQRKFEVITTSLDLAGAPLLEMDTKTDFTRTAEVAVVEAVVGPMDQYVVKKRPHEDVDLLDDDDGEVEILEAPSPAPSGFTKVTFPPFTAAARHQQQQLKQQNMIPPVSSRPPPPAGDGMKTMGAFAFSRE